MSDVVPAVPPAPRRAFDVTIRVGADTWEAAQWALGRLIRHVIDHGPECNMVSGGYSTGSTVDIVVNHDPTMTHDRYFEELQPHLDALKAQESAARRPNDQGDGHQADDDEPELVEPIA